MEPSETPNPPITPAPNTKPWGILVVVVAVIFGGGWTMLMWQGESLLLRNGLHRDILYGTFIAVASTLALIVAGVLLLSSSAGHNLATFAFWLLAAAAAGYVFGVVVCVVGH